MPIFYPGNTQETLDYGLYAIALSRWSGAWVGDEDGDQCLRRRRHGGRRAGSAGDPACREGYEKKFDARLIIPFTLMLETEVNTRRLDAAREFARLNGFNRSFGARENARLGILTAGKSYYDLMQALRDLGIGRDDLEALGIRIAKLGMTFPLEPRFITEFAEGLETILVVEEKRSFLEFQLREVLYNQPRRPIVIGKHDADGKPLLPAAGELDPELIARVLAGLLGRTGGGRRACGMLEEIEARERRPVAPRLPTFCSGCPHNRSTLLLDGQIAGGGIGCHGMAATLDAHQPRLRVPHAHGRRGRAVDRHVALRGSPAHFPEHRRRHVFPLGRDGRCGLRRGRREHHLQDPVQLARWR